MRFLNTCFYAYYFELSCLCRSKDPIFNLATQLKPAERKTFTTKILKLPDMCNNNAGEKSNNDSKSGYKNLSTSQGVATVKQNRDNKNDISDEMCTLKPGWFGKGCRKRVVKRRRSSQVSVEGVKDDEGAKRIKSEDTEVLQDKSFKCEDTEVLQDEDVKNKDMKLLQDTHVENEDTTVLQDNIVKSEDKELQQDKFVKSEETEVLLDTEVKSEDTKLPNDSSVESEDIKVLQDKYVEIEDATLLQDDSVKSEETKKS